MCERQIFSAITICVFSVASTQNLIIPSSVRCHRNVPALLIVVAIVAVVAAADIGIHHMPVTPLRKCQYSSGSGKEGSSYWPVPAISILELVHVVHHIWHFGVFRDGQDAELLDAVKAVSPCTRAVEADDSHACSGFENGRLTPANRTPAVAIRRGELETVEHPACVRNRDFCDLVVGAQGALICVAAKTVITAIVVPTGTHVDLGAIRIGHDGTVDDQTDMRFDISCVDD